ncbi:response regulator transcription factor [Nitratiruptor sp. SB155-2]|uniref:response regulator transcription factor n=1 Tax=Nitratiruptor sp. (strain SB155-2) TaxID=387092 RepID=UPI0001586FF4|nr:response regulator transcription factor [Nitratiruptor sp. SB155-2]BAF70820.1 two-component response regulator [Nitratiruptor sp. SB155-2]
MKVAMIEDDVELAEILSEFLERYGIEVENYEDPFIALSALHLDNTYDALILDLTLPGMDGLEILKKLREFSDIPIIISSARSDLSDKVIGLELGADDYLPKPYDPKELEARLKAILRRRAKPQTKEQSFTLYPNRREIHFHGKPLQLTPAEFEILSYLIERPNQPISREDLLYNCEHLSENASDKTVDVIISRIRHKLGENPKQPKHIQSVRGVGYKFTP